MRRRQVLAALAMAAMPLTAAAAGMSGMADAGHALLDAKCSGCHATSTDDASPEPAAPTLRNVAHRYPPADLGEALAEGIFTGHPDMPEFVLQPDEIDAIVAYLEWLRAQ